MSERDKAIIEEAYRRAQLDNDGPTWWAEKIARIALELDRSGWQPTDPDVLVVREVLAAAHLWTYNNDTPSAYRRGDCDGEPSFKAALAAYRKHKGGANAAD